MEEWRRAGNAHVLTAGDGARVAPALAAQPRARGFGHPCGVVSAGKGRRARPLLQDVGQLVGDKASSVGRVRSKFTRPEDDLRTDGIRPRSDGARRSIGAVVKMYANVAEIVTEPVLHKSPERRPQWGAGSGSLRASQADRPRGSGRLTLLDVPVTTAFTGASIDLSAVCRCRQPTRSGPGRQRQARGRSAHGNRPSRSSITGPSRMSGCFGDAPPPKARKLDPVVSAWCSSAESGRPRINSAGG